MAPVFPLLPTKKKKMSESSSSSSSSSSDEDDAVVVVATKNSKKTASKKSTAKKAATKSRKKPSSPTIEQQKKKKPKLAAGAKVAPGKGKGSRPKNFNEWEDLYLSMAYVSTSEDPIKGADQKSETFWNGVREKFVEIRLESTDEGVELQDRSATSYQNRFQRHIAKDVLLFNKFYKHVWENKPMSNSLPSNKGTAPK